MKIGKYQFDNKEKAQVKIDSLGTATNDEGNQYPSHKHLIVNLGNIVLEQAIIDEDGEVLIDAVLSTKWHIDALWIDLDKHPYGWKSYSINLASEGSHGFSGLSYLKYKL
tara:strand:+ start:831 stop:1160 length:330 start_codon:yes stop_codon:yes gene_type:complete